MSDAHINASTASSIDNRTCCPSPVRSRASSAAVIACEAVIAVNLSGKIVRNSRGRASSEPACTVASPENPWITGS